MEILSQSIQKASVSLASGIRPAKISAPPSSSNQQSYLAQVIKLMANTNFASVKVLSTLQTIQIESTNKLNPGQLISITPQGRELILQTNVQQTADQILRLLLPRQGSIREALVSLVRTILNNEASSHEDRSPNMAAHQRQGKTQETNNLVSALVKQLPTRTEIVKPELLKQLIQNTGLFHAREGISDKPLTPQSALAQKTNTLGQSLLPILKVLLQNNSFEGKSELYGRIADLIARIILNQIRPLNNLAGDDVESRRSELVARNENQLDGFKGEAPIFEDKISSSLISEIV
jgi:hypothetical protein